MNPLLAIGYAIAAATGKARQSRDDKTLLVCANCETENEAHCACCKKCGRNYLIRRKEFKMLQEEARQVREKRQDARNTLFRLRSTRQCAACECEYTTDYAHCTACGLPVVCLSSAQVFERMRKAHKQIVHTPADIVALDAQEARHGKGLFAALRDWWAS